MSVEIALKAILKLLYEFICWQNAIITAMKCCKNERGISSWCIYRIIIKAASGNKANNNFPYKYKKRKRDREKTWCVYVCVGGQKRMYKLQNIIQIVWLFLTITAAVPLSTRPRLNSSLASAFILAYVCCVWGCVHVFLSVYLWVCVLSLWLFS